MSGERRPERLHRLLVCGALLWLTVSIPPLTAQSGREDAPQPVAPVTIRADVVTLLLAGSDAQTTDEIGRTDALMLVILDPTAGHVAMLSIPRDLYVYIPGWGSNRINLAYQVGMLRGGAGDALLIETVRFNFGVQPAHILHIDGNGFAALVDALGGLDVLVECSIQDWRLRDAALDPLDEASWTLVTLPSGVQHLNGAQALWYVRSRRTSSDFDRGRRQQDVMRALLQRARARGLLTRLDTVWDALAQMIDTDLSLPEAAALAPLALRLTEADIVSYTLRQGVEVEVGTLEDGASVVLLNQPAVAALLAQVYAPPADYQAAREQLTVALVNGSGDPLPVQAAAVRLARAGFSVTQESETQPVAASFVTDYTGRVKGGALPALLEALSLDSSAVTSTPNPDRTTDFQVQIGADFDVCPYGVLPVEAETLVSLPE